MMDPIIDPPPKCLSDMLIVGHSMTSYTIGEIRKLERALAAAQAERESYREMWKAEQKEVAAWEAAAAALRVDAERYRWLRNINSPAYIFWSDESADGGLAQEALDAAIDAARKDGNG